MQMKYMTAVCPYCGTGCSLNLVVTDSGVVGYAPYHRSPINRGKLCTRGLHAAKSVNEFRITKPLSKGNEVSEDSIFDEALKLKNYSGDDLAVFVSSRLTNEAIYLVKRFAKEILNCENVRTFTDAAVSKSVVKMDDLKKADAVLVIDDTMKKLPVSCNKLFFAQELGARIYYAGADSYSAVQADEAEIFEEGKFSIPQNFTDDLKAAKNAFVVCFAGSTFAKDAAEYAKANGLKFAELYETSNGRGAAELGCMPSYSEFKSAEKVPKAMLVFAECPEFDTEIYGELIPQFEKVEELVVAASHASVLTDIANAVIPLTSFAEYDGTLTNWEGRVQNLKAAAAAPAGVKTPYEIIKELSAKAGKEISFENAESIFAELKTKVPAYANINDVATDGVFIKEV
ncbi:MAG: molybdopterin-dependent oxidoreductase [Methanocorpusculum sp.]|nr:molybdopterin-dependent oxidoreductase [Methanocorpusculum sp.]